MKVPDLTEARLLRLDLKRNKSHATAPGETSIECNTTNNWAILLNPMHFMHPTAVHKG